MAKESGLGWTTFSIDQSSDGNLVALINDVLNVDWDMPRETLDVTGINLSAHERLAGLADFTVNITAAYNPASTGSSMAVFKDIGITDVARTIDSEVSGQGLNNECWFTSAALSRGSDGSFQFSATGVLQDGTDPTWS